VVEDAVAEPLLRWIPLLPLLSAALHGVLLGILRRPLTPNAVAVISCTTPLLSLLCTGAAFATLVGLPSDDGFLLDTAYTWIGAGLGDAAFSADLSFQFDALSAVMALLVTGAGFAIHVYAVGYMGTDERDDRGFQRFFCYLNLFLAAMLVLVLADNLLLMFLGWEGVGLCSYLLIGFWYGDAENADAGSKAFIINRIGDFGFVVGILLLFWALSEAGAPTISFRGIEAAFADIAQRTLMLPGAEGREILLVDVIGLCFFLAACAKSAQLPFHIWLPDAMAGPTPVSALVHSATMVTAGVFLVCRLSFLYAAAPAASAVIAWVGGLTALFAAAIAVGQRDIKQVLAYSTMSQLGLMFLAVGCGAYATAMFHLVTHAFSKALLFLAAGAVIVVLHREQDLFRMGALRNRLPKTRVMMLVGVLAIAGAPGLSGFFSGEEVLVAALGSELPGHATLYWMGVMTALLTSFYMFRMYFLVFEGESRVEREVRARLSEPGNVVLGPLYFFALLSVLGGFLGLSQFWGDMIGIDDSDSLANFVQTVIVRTASPDLSSGSEWQIVVTALAVWLLGAVSAWWLYLRNPALVEAAGESVATLAEVLRRGFFVDALYDRTIVRPLVAFSDRVLYRGIDKRLIDGIVVSGTARSIWLLAQRVLKLPQSGMTQGYLFVMVAGMLALLLYLVR
jgi:NADH-quinone oxidoreductase subunit L